MHCTMRVWDFEVVREGRSRHAILAIPLIIRQTRIHLTEIGTTQDLSKDLLRSGLFFSSTEQGAVR